MLGCLSDGTWKLPMKSVLPTFSIAGGFPHNNKFTRNGDVNRIAKRAKSMGENTHWIAYLRLPPV